MAVMVTKLTDAHSDMIMMPIKIVAFHFITYKDLPPTSVAIVRPIVLWGRMLREFRHEPLSYCISEVEPSLDFTLRVLLRSPPHPEAPVMSRGGL